MAEDSPILGTDVKRAPGQGGSREDGSLVRQTPRSNRSGFDRRLCSRERERMIRKVRRSEARVRGAGFGRRPLDEEAA
jgi:hypothetical protein